MFKSMPFKTTKRTFNIFADIAFFVVVIMVIELIVLLFDQFSPWKILPSVMLGPLVIIGAICGLMLFVSFVYCLANIHLICSKCSGRGKIKMNKEKIICPECGSSGQPKDFKENKV